MSALTLRRDRRSRATIRDVAALAGVGIKTVSRVINNEANVSPQMRERVERAIVDPQLQATPRSRRAAPR